MRLPRSSTARPLVQLLFVPLCLLWNTAEASAQSGGAAARDGARIGGGHTPEAYSLRTGAFDAPPTESTTHDFDFLLGNWEFTAESKVPGTPAKYYGRWTCARIGDGALVEDDYKAYDGGGRRVYLGVTIRAFDATAKRWTTAFVQFKTLQGGGPAPGANWSLGTAWRQADEMQEGPLDDSKPTRARAHFYDIAPDHFSWRMDRSTDGGRTWTTDYLRVQARRVPAVPQSGK